MRADVGNSGCRTVSLVGVEQIVPPCAVLTPRRASSRRISPNRGTAERSGIRHNGSHPQCTSADCFNIEPSSWLDRIQCTANALGCLQPWQRKGPLCRLRAHTRHKKNYQLQLDPNKVCGLNTLLRRVLRDRCIEAATYHSRSIGQFRMPFSNHVVVRRAQS